jgi:RNA polymerase sigma factor (sigma-70 family)
MTLSASTDSIHTVNATTTLARPGGPRLAGPLLRTQSDERLAALAGEGSQQAFDEMVKRHRPALVAYARRVAPSDRADDVVQDSLVKAFLALRRGDRPELPKAWLFKIVRNTALNDQRDWKQFDHLDENYDGVEQPPAAAERRRELKQLVVALSDLPEAQRKAIVQRELEGRGHDEIARELSVSPGAVRQLIFRARGTLRAGLGALVPMQLLRWVALAGADPAAPVAAGAGLGLGAAKVGLGAVLATGAVVVGAQVGSDIKSDRGSKPASIEKSSSALSSEAATTSEGVGGPGESSKGNQRTAAAGKQGLDNSASTRARAQLAPPPPRRLNQPPPSQPPRPGGQQPGQQSGPGGTTTSHPPRDGSGQYRPPPPPGDTSGTGTLPPPPSP